MRRDVGVVGCACWEVEMDPVELEGVLAEARKENPRVIIQAFRSGAAPNFVAMEMVAAQTIEAAESGGTLAEKPELDLLLRLAGTRQIGEAIRQLGYRSKGKRLFLVAAWKGRAEPRGLKRLAERDGRFEPLDRRPLRQGDLDLVERAAILAAGL